MAKNVNIKQTIKKGYQEQYRIELTANGLAYVLGSCNFLAYMKSTPPSFGNVLWQRGGHILVHFGLEGEKLWEQMHYTDLVDPANKALFDKKLKELKGNRQIPKCTALKKEGYCGSCNSYTTPMDIIYEYLSTRQPFVSHSANWKPISIEDARDKLLKPQIANLMSNLQPGIYHVDCPNGIGKTQALIEHLPKCKTVWLVPRHDLGKETQSKFNVLNSYNVERYLSRSQMVKEQLLNCPNYKMEQFCVNRGIPFSQHYCAHCGTNRVLCSFYNNTEDVKIADVVIGVHDHLHWGKLLWDEYCPELLVIDECFVSKYRTKQEITDDDIDYTEIVVDNSQLTNSTKRQLKKALRQLKQGRIPVMGKDYWSNYLIRQCIVDMDRQLASQYGNKRLMLSDLQYLFLSGKNCTKIPIGYKRFKYSYIRTASLPDNIPIVILDSTTTTAQYSKLLGKPVSNVSLGTNQIQHSVKVTQFLDGAYPKASFYNNPVNTVKDIVSKIQSVVKGVPLNFITHTDIEQTVGSMNGASGVVLHFGAVSGLNTLQNADAVVVIGFPMISHDTLVEGAYISFDTGWSEQVKASILNSVTKTWGPLCYHDDKVQVMTTTHKYMDSRAQDYYEIIPKGNYLQALGRIRPFEKSNSPTIRELIVVCNQDTAPIPVDNLRLLKDSKLKKTVWKPKGKQIRTVEAIKRLLSKKEEINTDNVVKELEELCQNALSSGDRDLASEYIIKRQTVHSHLTSHKDDLINAAKACQSSNLSTGVLDPSIFDSIKYMLGYAINSPDFSKSKSTEMLLELTSTYLRDLNNTINEQMASEYFNNKTPLERLRMINEILSWTPEVKGFGIRLRML